MKKIDFHIHTIATVSDQDFTFDQSVLINYINELSLDAIAITNHNLFDISQYELLLRQLNNGISISYDTGKL